MVAKGIAKKLGERPLFSDLHLTLFPGMLEGPLAESIPGRVQARGLATVLVHDLRHWGLGRHKSVDDYTYGGGAGMVLRPEPVAAAETAPAEAAPSEAAPAETREAVAPVKAPR